MFFDYIVFGLGLAGAAVALRLHRAGKRILVIDAPSDNTSTRIAAGIFNPVTGRHMTKTWLADQLFPALLQYYRDAERTTGVTFFYPMPVYRPFLSVEEQNEWMGKSSDPVYAPFILNVLKASSNGGVNDPLGGLLLQHCGFLDTNAYVKAVRNIISREQHYIGERIDLNGLHVDDDGVSIAGYTAGKAVFCTGVHGNSWFGWLPVRPLKGETLEITTALDSRWIVNRGAYLVPHGAHWRAGATYRKDDHIPGTTEESRGELTAAIKELIHLPFEVTGQQWGFRPTTPDRRPMLGRHPDHHRLWIFNGLGTKGVSLAPYFSGVLIDAIENGTPLNKDVDVERYKSLYSGSLT